MPLLTGGPNIMELRPIGAVVQLPGSRRPKPRMPGPMARRGCISSEALFVRASLRETTEKDH
eukprot:766967-Hanusia_phi.AAC.3